MGADIANAIECITTIPTEAIVVTVRDGWVCLGGTLKERHQKEFVEEVVRHLTCVRGVTNLITIESTPLSAELNETNLNSVK
jgi:osmotically-inducible protein OsmY